ncbi:Retrovirus-related Pol polyprotein [Arachis hypogaea]|nr:Retrovirus-related Pol polyprotein [Arachis hypogaea]
MFFADDLLVFAEANKEQIEKVKNCLKKFCNIFDLKISVAKIALLFSNNVTREKRRAILEVAQFEEKPHLGRYLRAIISNHIKGSERFKNVIDRVKSKLKG